MKRRFTILVRRFGPFETAVRTFWDQLADTRGVDLELELVPLDLPELHAAILTKRFDVAHVNTDWLTECWARGCLEDLTDRVSEDPPEDYPAGWPDSAAGAADVPGRPGRHPLPRRARVPHLPQGPLRVGCGTCRRSVPGSASSWLRPGPGRSSSVSPPSSSVPSRACTAPSSPSIPTATTTCSTSRCRSSAGAAAWSRRDGSSSIRRRRATPSSSTGASSTAPSSTRTAGGSNPSAPAGPSRAARSP